MVDRVQAIKWESVSGGGTDEDTVPTEIDFNEDGLDMRSAFLQNDTSADKDVTISRDASDNLTFTDKVIGSVKTLTELAAASAVGHPWQVTSGNTLTIDAGRQFDHIGRFKIDGRVALNGRFALGL